MWTWCPGKQLLAGLLATLSLAASAAGQEWLDRVEDNSHLQSRDGVFRTDLTVLLDAEGYYVDQRPPGLLYEDESFFNPRATFFLDSRLGPHLYSLVQARLDTGFDPGEKNFEARLDEYLLRYTPFDDSRLNLQFGKFATVVGSWVQRHYSWDNPLITAPLPYENLTIVSDDDVPGSAADFLARRNAPDKKDGSLPVIWGPVYATGGSVFGTVGKLDYAAEFKNAALASNPYAWRLNEAGWRYPTFSGRVGVRPNEAWNTGVSLSAGPYIYYEHAADLPPGKSIRDYNQYTLDYDLSYAWHKWQLWSEVFLTRFQVPNIGDADALSYYVEAKYKLTARLYAAARWNQQIFGTIANGTGGSEAWNSDMLRADLALGCRFTRHLQAKIQYSFGHRQAVLQQGEQLVAGQVTVRF